MVGLGSNELLGVVKGWVKESYEQCRKLTHLTPTAAVFATSHPSVAEKGNSQVTLVCDIH